MNPATATLVARTEVRRTLRIFLGDRTKLALMGLVAVFALGPITLIGLLAMPTVGEEVAAGAVSDLAGFSISETAAGATAVAWIGLTVMAGIRTVTQTADVDQPECTLVSTTTGTTVVGLLGAELLLFAIWIVPPVALLAGAFAYGAGSVVPLVVALAVLGLVLLSAIPVGFLVGIWIRHLLTTYEPVARYRTLVFVAVGVAYFGAIAAGWFDSLMIVLFEYLGDSPAGWPGELLVFAVPEVTPSTLTIVGALVGTAVAVPLAVGASIASANVHWYADPARTDDAAEIRSSNRLDRLLSGSIDRATRTVAVTVVRRTKRAPVRLLYVAYPLFGSVFFIETVIQAGTLPAYVAVLLCAYVVWGAGALFSLNVLGDYGRALPAVLTTPVSGRQAVGGTIVASAVISVPIALLVSVTAGFVSPLSIESTAALVGATVVGSVVTPALATGLGAIFPRFGSVRLTSKREAVMPSKAAFVTYTLAIALPGGSAALLYTDGAADLVADVATAIGSFTPGPETAVSAGSVSTAAWAVLVVGLLAPVVSVLYAIEAFDEFELD
ncbi:hypothetical protein [Halovivax gelatinilyticus]|uniref:hypothetical protein n=1 Tax=Halovivax gelatinilyticus TaxID=2961597 RepID=UPI0020CA792D|nr:hypothetical protein [Halovivax gelatinilyticus]